MTKKLVFTATAIALAYVTSFIRLFSMPFGGSVTLFSMLWIVLIGYWLGPKYGFAGACVYGVLQFITDPVMLNFAQVLCDYFLAFTSLGIAGLFCAYPEDPGSGDKTAVDKDPRSQRRLRRPGRLQRPLRPHRPGRLRLVYLCAVMVRAFWSTLGGYFFWMGYMPENFPKSISRLYPIAYNYGFVLAEAVLTLILLSLPAVQKGLNHVRSLLYT